MRIVDDDSGFVVDVVADGRRGGELSTVVFCCIFDVGKTTVDGGLLRDTCEVLTKGFADADKDGFRER